MKKMILMAVTMMAALTVSAQNQGDFKKDAQCQFPL